MGKVEKYFFILFWIVALSSPLMALPQKTWGKYGGDGIATIQLPGAWEVENGKAERPAVFTFSSQSDLFVGLWGMTCNMQENLSAYNADLGLSLEYISLWTPYKRLKHLSIEDCVYITRMLNKERFLKLKPQEQEGQEKESLHSIKLVKKEFLNIGGPGFPVLTYELSTNMDFFNIRYVIALHQDKKRQDKILALRFLYSSPETSEEEEASAVALADAITSEWGIVPPGPYVEVSFVAITIISVYLLIWSGLLIKRLCRKDQGRSTAPAYPHCLRHLETFKGRLAYCPVFLLPFLFDAGRYLYPGELFGMSLVALISGTIVLSALHLIAKEWKPWEGRGKPFRVTVFMMGLWVIVVFAFALIVGPARFDPEETKERSVIVANILLWSLAPAVLGGAVSYIYQKYIK